MLVFTWGRGGGYVHCQGKIGGYTSRVDSRFTFNLKVKIHLFFLTCGRGGGLHWGGGGMHPGRFTVLVVTVFVGMMVMMVIMVIMVMMVMMVML